ncbi:MAG: thermonuclease family protein, partial [bacterium]|nr:thermonuclease family protein [bacterium]
MKRQRANGWFIAAITGLAGWAGLAAAPPAAAEELTGRVLTVLSGDTFQIISGRDLVTIRLAGADCPERQQEFGGMAKEFTEERIGGKTVTVDVREHTPQGQVIGETRLPDGRELSRELVAAGLAWSQDRYAPDKELRDLETAARNGRRGLWARKRPATPWEFRQKDYENRPGAPVDPVDQI